MSDRPPPPPAVKCATCGRVSEWVWDDDLPLPYENDSYTPQPGYYEIDDEWWGEAYHCSGRCYREGAEYRSQTPA